MKSKRKLKYFAIGSLATVLFIALVVFLFDRRELKTQDLLRHSRIQQPRKQQPLPSPSVLSRSSLPRHDEPKHSTPEVETSWKEFQNQFGAQLKPEFTSSGKLVSVQGQLGSGQQASRDFRSDDPKKAIARAREIITAASALLGIDPKWPLDNPLARGNKISAQVFFNQTYEGLTIAPVGSVKVDLGSKGELIALYSNYATDIQVVNEVRIDPAEAQLKVVEAFQDSNNTSLHVDGGGKVIWVKGHFGRYAYQFITQGRQVIVDAQTGVILDRKDIRQH